MNPTPVRVRFAPSPTGLMHLGSARLALFNYLFARHFAGSFILRIEDTDLERNFDPGGAIIMEDLAWLNLTYQEGPNVGGSHAPYLQSKRTPIYQEQLTRLINKNAVYRCFCTVQELEKKRDRQIAMKQPPRYDRVCFKLKKEEVDKKLLDNTPFIWRFLVPDKTIKIVDLARGEVTFNLNNFSDFPLTRADGSFTFMFVNCVDDIMMDITHVIRGEDHLSNTANQVALYSAFDAQVPYFWHMPMICNSDGKKLSKRDFGFSLRDLKEAGFLPEAINNYLAIIGASFEQEIMTLDELTHKIPFEKMHSVNSIKYDLEKLRWVNHQWIIKMPLVKLTEEIIPYLKISYPNVQTLDQATLLSLTQLIQQEIHTLKEAVSALQFYFSDPVITREKLTEFVPEQYLDAVLALIGQHISLVAQPEVFINTLKSQAASKTIATKAVFTTLRMLLTGNAHGHSILDLLNLLGIQKSRERLEKASLFIKQ